jgi:protein SCO1/2
MHDRQLDMRRRTLLAGLGTSPLLLTAGCLGTLGGGNQNTVLRKPDRGGTTSADLPYPAWGERIPDVTLPAPLRDESVSLRDVERPFFTTFFYTHCRTVCPALISTLRQIQTHSVENDYAYDVAFYPIDFDPARDTPEILSEYADRMNIDTSAGNWAFLRPEDEAAAKDVVTDEFGIVYETVDSEYSAYEFVHTTIITLVNADGYVERTYRLGQGGIDQLRLIDDLRTVRNGGGIL